MLFKGEFFVAVLHLLVAVLYAMQKDWFFAVVWLVLAIAWVVIAETSRRAKRELKKWLEDMKKAKAN